MAGFRAQQEGQRLPQGADAVVVVMARHHLAAEAETPQRREGAYQCLVRSVGRVVRHGRTQ
ncbi:hypothetical protein GCM10017771_48370 [Streptomyces capitiformicae]|uniref:Uncharacterized protein n=1 Tax=Streptomyces capitiformicae TaxID=2014920 RepID=A0A918YZZ7_9ACTN|nr:hypothetical protein GCM10017771_48370 [Streptomyces capitiformicae]